VCYSLEVALNVGRDAAFDKVRCEMNMGESGGRY
jgi:hypothetical protein